jgi:thymidine phosphorylase
VGTACGIQVRCILTDGSRPIGAGIGPVEEARDLLAVLQNAPGAPADLRERSLELSANLLDLAHGIGMQAARERARQILSTGQAWQQFQRIADAQGGLRELPQARCSAVVKSERNGLLKAIDNRRLARLAKLAGAPMDLTAGLRLHANVGSILKRHEPLFTLYSDSPGERDYALDYYHSNSDMFLIDES